MSYVEKNLMNGEAVVYSGKLNWTIFLQSAFWFVISVVAYIISYGKFDNNLAVVLVWVLPLMIAMLSGLLAFITYKTSEFAITNRRVIVKVGFIRTNSLEILLGKIESIQVNQSVLGRIFGFGSISVRGTGGTLDPFDRIDAPMVFRTKAQEQIALMQDSRSV